MQPPQRALAAAIWNLWRRQRRELDSRMRSALGLLGRLLRVTDLRVPSVSDLESLLHDLAGPGTADSGGGGHRAAGDMLRPAKVARVATPPPQSTLPPLSPMPPAEPQGLVKYIDAMDCCACEAAVRLHGVPCASCAGRLASKLVGADANTTALACAALGKLADVQQSDADQFVAVVTAVAMPGVVFSTRQIAMHVPLVFEHGLPLVDWLQLCMAAAQQLQHEELFSVFAGPRFGDSMPLVDGGRSRASPCRDPEGARAGGAS